MKRVPRLLRDALRTRVDGHVVELDPVARSVWVTARDGSTEAYRIDFYDGFKSPAILDGEDRTTDIIRAIGALLEGAFSVAVDYELAGFAALRAGDDAGWKYELAYVKAAETMRAYADALRELECWRAFHLALAERLAQRAAAQ